MGKYTYIGGDYFENIGGSKIVYVKGNNETHSNGQIIQTAEKGISFGEPKDPPVKESEVDIKVIKTDFLPFGIANFKGEKENDIIKFEILSKKGIAQNLTFYVKHDGKIIFKKKN